MHMNAGPRSLTQALTLQPPRRTRIGQRPEDGTRRQMLAGVGTAIGWMRAATLDDAGRATQELARALGDQTERSMQAIDLLVRGAVAHLADVTPPGDQLPADLTMEAYHRTLRAQLAQLPQLEALGLVDSNGQVVNSTRIWPPAPLNVADRDYFQVLQFASRARTYIGRPVQSRATGEWSIYLSHRVENSEGAFLGAVVGTLSLRYVEQFFEAVLSRPGSSVRLLRRQGSLLASHPHQDSPIPMSANAPEDWERLLAAGGGQGTLRKRYHDAAGPWVWGKTGTLSNNLNVCGYLRTKSGRLLAFTFLNNNHVADSGDIRNEMERVLRQVRERL